MSLTVGVAGLVFVTGGFDPAPALLFALMMGNVLVATIQPGAAAR